MKWRYCSEDWQSVSLHDNFISKMRFENDITLDFEDGFDVCAENPLNDTGRHKYTGKAAVLLKNGKFISAEYSSYYDRDNGNVPAKKMSLKELLQLKLEVYGFEYESGIFTMSCNIWEHAKSFCEFKICCEKPQFCWNELLGDAWFQDYDKKSRGQYDKGKN